ncbi:hypothetical protein LEM8419_02365 [Neolewinella maritima]|uniref:Peptidase M43 pregnancy-associated plasma-A domain-containing protein n=1 Tax=Neolewinella maritima TaxID=1383882 RepID=A0ABN8F5Z9_9BACT|nr:M43 family zinc metalloprotease [Neolewinella maritima]CAH1001462.1 hypothetical protein LEM8419_02365 [Neolewinella maritima]
MNLRLLLFTCLLAVSGLASAQRNCGSMDYLEQQIQQDPTRQLQLERIERFTEQYDAAAQEKALSGGILTIPVIVHVVYKNSTENISDAQINSQIQVLNEDFRRLNADRSNTPADFVGVAADSEIEFCLTTVNRVATTRSSFGTNDAVKSSGTGGANAINPTQSLNMWICEIGGSILGYAQFPGGPAATDGVVLDYRFVGTTGTASAPFDLGRTATHEVGHWLNLRHIWGDGGCSVDDFVSDTPTAGAPNYTGGACVYPGPNSCAPKGKKNTGNDLPDMFQNYMDYSDDGCMNLFTIGQKDRMWAAVSAARPELLSSSCDGTVTPPTDPEPEPPTAGCAAPTGLQATRSNRNRTANFSWLGASGALNYEIEVYANGSLFASGTVNGTAASLTVDRRTTYTWRVRSNCDGATSDWTNGNNFRQAASSALAQEISVFPNPSDLGEVTVSWDLQPATTLAAPTAVLTEGAVIQQISIELRDMTGRLLRQVSVADTGRSMLPVSDLAPGVYLIHVRDAEGYAVSSRFVKL